MKYYKARFQMEFLFRDAKQYTGLENCQARSENKLDFHFNASLSSLNVAKVLLRNNLDINQPRSYSINDLKISFQNRNMLKRILSIYRLDYKLIKNDSRFKEILYYGAIAA